jgi:hypothetical protein
MPTILSYPTLVSWCPELSCGCCCYTPFNEVDGIFSLFPKMDDGAVSTDIAFCGVPFWAILGFASGSADDLSGLVPGQDTCVGVIKTQCGGSQIISQTHSDSGDSSLILPSGPGALQPHLKINYQGSEVFDLGPPTHLTNYANIPYDGLTPNSGGTITSGTLVPENPSTSVEAVGWSANSEVIRSDLIWMGGLLGYNIGDTSGAQYPNAILPYLGPIPESGISADLTPLDNGYTQTVVHAYDNTYNWISDGTHFDGDTALGNWMPSGIPVDTYSWHSLASVWVWGVPYAVRMTQPSVHYVFGT